MRESECGAGSLETGSESVLCNLIDSLWDDHKWYPAIFMVIIDNLWHWPSQNSHSDHKYWTGYALSLRWFHLNARNWENISKHSTAAEKARQSWAAEPGVTQSQKLPTSQNMKEPCQGLTKDDLEGSLALLINF